MTTSLPPYNRTCLIPLVFAAVAETLQTQADRINTGLGADNGIADSDAECQAIVAKLKEAA